MTAQRYRCTDRHCGRYARVTVEDTDRERAGMCARDTVAALERLAQARAVREDIRGTSEHEAAALQLAGERSQLSRKDAAA